MYKFKDLRLKMFEYYETHFSINLPKPEIDTNSKEFNWVRYNPRKEILRWGASLTSLDGGMSGVPDLDSIREYNKENNTDYREKSFNVKTPLFRHFSFLDQHFDLGRSHILRLGPGGYFPYHRDYDGETFRLIYTINGCQEENFVWILQDKVIKLQNHKWYYINTKMIHSVFSFNGCEFAVFNVLVNQRSKSSLVDLMSTL